MVDGTLHLLAQPSGIVKFGAKHVLGSIDHATEVWMAGLLLLIHFNSTARLTGHEYSDIVS